MLDLDREDIGAGGGGIVISRGRAVQRFVGHDRKGGGSTEPGHASAVAAVDRLLDQVAPRIGEHGDASPRVDLVPRHVDVDADRGTGTKRALDGRDMRDVLGERALADLQLEGIVAPTIEHVLGLGDVPGGISARQSP